MNKAKIAIKIKYFFLIFALLFLTQSHYTVSFDPDIIEQFEGYVESFSFSNNSRYLAVLLWDNTLQVFRIKSNKLLLRCEEKGVKEYSFSENSNYVAITFWSGNLHVLDLRNLKTLLTLTSVKKFIFSPNSKYICVLFKLSDIDSKDRDPGYKHMMKVFGLVNQYSL